MDVEKYYSGEIISGIEIKCAYKGRLIEVLGYNYDTEKMQLWIDEYYKDKQRDIVQTKYFNLLYDACIKLGLKMSPKDEIIWNPNNDWASFTIYNQFKKFEENREKLPQDLWEDFTTFTKKYCGDLNSVFHIDKSNDYPTLDVAIKAIKDCGGIALMAHIFIYKWATDKKELINDIIENYDIDGFECYYTKFTQEQTDYIVDICKKNNFFMSGGSDYHGMNKPDVMLGVGNGNLCVHDEIIDAWYPKNMDEYDREAAILNIQEIIVKKIKSLKPSNMQDLTQIMKPLYDEREAIMRGDEGTIRRYRRCTEDK